MMPRNIMSEGTGSSKGSNRRRRLAEAKREPVRRERHVSKRHVLDEYEQECDEAWLEMFYEDAQLFDFEVYPWQIPILKWARR